MRRIVKWAAAAAVIGVLGGGVYWFVQSGGKSISAEESVESTATVRRGDIRQTISGTSQLSTQNLQNIAASADGTIKTMNLTRSQTVKQGDVLVEISSSTLEASLKDAQTTLDTLQQELDALMEQKRNLTIVAPASGKLALGSMDVGSQVSKSAKLGTVSDETRLTVKLPFALEEAAQFKAGDGADVAVEGFGLTRAGVVQSVGTVSGADASGGRLVEVTITVDNDGTLTAGMTATGSVVVGGREMQAKGSSQLEARQTTVLLSQTSGMIAQMLKKNGDTVSAGERMATVVNDTLDESIVSKQSAIERQQRTVEAAQQKVDDLVLRAPFDGVFSTDFANQRTNVLANYPVGATVSAGSVFGAVASLDVMTLPIQVDELDLVSVTPGLKAEVTVDAIAGRIFQGEVLQVSTVGTTSNGVTYYDAVIAVDNKDQLLKYGMTGTAQVLVQNRQNVLTVPIEAIRRQRGSTTVTVKRPDGTTEENVAIQTGIQNQTSIEVTGGLQEGDVVVLPRSRTSGSTNAQQQMQQMMQGGFPGGAGGFPGGGQGGGGGAPSGGFGGGAGGAGGGGGRQP